MTSNEKLFYKICDYNGLHYEQHPTLYHIMWVRQPYVDPNCSILFHNNYDDYLSIADSIRLDIDRNVIVYGKARSDYNDEAFKLVLKQYNKLIYEIKQLQLKQKLERINNDF